MRRRFASETMAAQIFPPAAASHIAARVVLVAASLTLFVVALAGPQWGDVVEAIPQTTDETFVILDVSRSMLAEDVVPTRLARAKSDILDLLAVTAGERVGLIVFAGTPRLLVPLTTDVNFFRETLEKVDPSSAPSGGTAIGDAIRKGLAALSPVAAGTSRQTLVLLTDGEDQQSFLLEAAEAAAARGVRILTVALGDATEGGRIPIRDTESGKVSFLQHEGREVWSRVDTAALDKIAATTHGVALETAGQHYDLGEIFIREFLHNSTESTTSSHATYRHRESRFQLFVLLGVASLFVFVVRTKKM
ncbi:MAG: VWA domain-containing protein [Thermoguttaceae bacterium]